MSRMKARMDVAERAKQFMPFAALKGLPEALAEKERIIVPRMELSEETADDLDRKMRMAERGKNIAVIYFQEGEYRKTVGVVNGIDEINRILHVSDTKIRFDDIVDLQIEAADLRVSDGEYLSWTP